MAAQLPDYVASAQPLGKDARVPWYANIAPTYAGIMLWFVFWHDVPVGSNLSGGLGQYSTFAGGSLAGGLAIALLGLVIAALICHFLFYVVPGMLGMKTGLPLYIVGTSTYGVQGGFLMPGFIMGLLQFGWLAVNAFFAGILLCAPWGHGAGTVQHGVVATLWAVAAAFMGLKGIQYVAKVASILPLVPFVILIWLVVSSIGSVGSFDAEKAVAAGEGKTYQEVVSEEVTHKEIGDPEETEDKDSGITTREVAVKEVKITKTKTLTTKGALPLWGIIAMICTYVVGFFATAGAAGTDIAMNARNAKDVQMGGIFGIALATIYAGGLALLFVVGMHGTGELGDGAVLRATGLMPAAVGEETSQVLMYLLAIAAFPAACFSAFIAANSFKTTLPKVNPFITVGIGTAFACFLAVSGYAGNAIGVFKIIGASFGPICGAMAADYLLSGRKWAGPRAGFNPAGWISWAVGFVVGAADFIPALSGKIPAPPVAAFVVGFVLYFALAQAGLESEKIDMPQRIDKE